MAEERVQRRLAAILAADVVGYTRLMDTDEAGTLVRLKSLRSEVFDPKTEEFGGRIFKNTGDGALAEFGSSVDAVQCAVEIQRALAARNAEAPEDHELILRVGISQGDVIVDGEDLYGNGVNVAARMEGLAEPGGICISGNVQEHIGNTLDIALEDLGEQSVKNIDRPIHAYMIDLDSQKPASIRTAEIDAVLSLPAVAVLPFENLSGDPEQEYFADGLTEDIITALSLWKSFPVIARNSTFAYKNTSPDVRKVGEELGARYVVEGSIRKGGDRIRVTAQLIDALSGHHIWAERYDRDLKDIFAVQDEITQAVVSTLPHRLEDAGRERAQRKRNPDLTAYDFVLLGLESLNRITWEGQIQGRRYARMAIEQDPLFARAHALLAASYLWELLRHAPDSGSLDEAYNSANNALALEEEDSWSHGVFSWALFLRREDEQCEYHLKRALALNPNDANAAAYYGSTLVYFGRWEEGLDWIAKAMRLNPITPPNYRWYQGTGLYFAREYEQAIQTVKQTRVLDYWHHWLLAICYGQSGRADEAKNELELFFEAPERIEIARSSALHADAQELINERVNRYRKKEDREHLLDGLRKAGWEG